MKKIGILFVCLLLVGAVFFSGCTEDKNNKPTGEKNDVVLSADISLDEAIAILMGILGPSGSDLRVSAFMLSEPLLITDIVTSEAGDSYELEDITWFAFIDDAPNFMFSHPTRYVMIDGIDGSYEIVNEVWPPLVNGFSMWDSDNLGRGEVIEFYPVLNMSVPVNTGSQSAVAPSGDYGDAPDGEDAYYGVEGKFPTYYETSNSVLGRPGGHTITTGEETIGLSVSEEVDVDDPDDPDKVANMVDSDRDDRLFVHMNLNKAEISFTVSVDANAPDVSRYVNVLIDFDQDGNWTEGGYGSEWPVRNLLVNVSPGETKTVITPSFAWGNSNTVFPSPAWMRMSLTRTKVNESLFSDFGGWDGSGAFNYGEIEDHLVYLIDNPPEPDDEWPPGNSGGGSGESQPPGGESGPCGTDVNYHSLIINGGDSSKHMERGAKPAETAVSTMTKLLSDQGYSSVGSLGPGSNSLSSIESAFETLKSQVLCGDHVLIYIVGHGNPSDSDNGVGINLKGSTGKTNALLTPSKLSSLLAKIPACENEFCDDSEVNCHVTVVIESCYAGNFNVDGVKGKGRTVMGSCDDEPADAAGGGVFTSGFNEASRSEGSDVNDDDIVSPSEAYDVAKGSVDKNNAKPSRKKKEDQEPWKDSQECECKCPNNPSITGGKYIWDGSSWVDTLAVSVGDTVRFRLELENNGKYKNVQSIQVSDNMPSGLSYDAGSGFLYQDEVSLGSRDYCYMADGYLGDVTCTWGLSEISSLAPSGTIAIEYTATALTDGTYTNYYYASAFCSADTSVMVSYEDSASITIT